MRLDACLNICTQWRPKKEALKKLDWQPLDITTKQFHLRIAAELQPDEHSYNE